MAKDTARMKNTLTLKQKARIIRMLEDNLTLRADGLFEYGNAHTDATIAQEAQQELGVAVGEKMVGGIRREVFGKIARQGGVAVAERDQLINELLTRVERIEKELGLND